MGLYAAGVFLIREAMVRWRRGWASVFLLGFAYAIVEEGLALRTLYDPNSPQVGSLGIYGHWMGVNWVWTAGLLLFHSVFSITLPIVLFRLAFPRLKGESLIHRRGVSLCLTVLTADSIVLSGIAKYDPGLPILLSSGLAVLIFILAARNVPMGLLSAKTVQPTHRPRTLALIGALFFPSTLFTGALLASANVSPVLPIVTDFFLAGLLVKVVFRWIGSEKNQAHKTALALGLIAPVVGFGLALTLALNPLILLSDVLFLFFMRRLWHKSHPSALRFSSPFVMGPGPISPGTPNL